MSDFSTQHTYKGHLINIFIHPAPLGGWTWYYTILGLNRQTHGKVPASSYDEVLTSALDSAKRYIDDFARTHKEP